MKCLNFLALLLIVIGALNWGLWGFFQFDIVAWLCGGNTTWPARFAYAILGLAGVWSLGFFGKCKSICSGDDQKSSGSGCCK